MTTPRWTRRACVEAALNHQEADRVPFDLGGTVVTGIHEKAYRRLRRLLRLPEAAIEIADPIQQIARVDDDLKERLGVDVYGITPGAARGFLMPRWSEGGYHKIRDEWGIEWWMPEDGGLYHDMHRHPLTHVDSAREIERWPLPDPVDPGRFEGFAERARELMVEKQVACVLGANAAGIFEMSVWLRGFDNYFRDLLDNRPLAEALLDRVCENKMRYWERALEQVGGNVTFVHEGDDLAAQDRLLISPALYREFLKPRHTRLFRFIREHAKACSAEKPPAIFFHSCGAVAPLIPDLIEAGIDVLNPAQVSAAGMDTARLKRLWGRDLTFYGGGVDTQRVLPHGTPAQVRDEVRRRIDDLAPGGGFIFATVHNIQADVPPANIVAMWEALREFGG